MNSYIALNTKLRGRAASLPHRIQGALCQERKGLLADILAQELRHIRPYLSKPSRDFVTSWAKNFDGYEALQAIKKLDKPDREALKRVFGTEIDLKNILIIYRLKKHFDTHGDMVYAHLIPSSYKLRAQEINQLAHAKDMTHFTQAAASGRYGAVFNNANAFIHAEQSLSRAVSLQFKEQSRRGGLAVVCGYLYSLRLEVQRRLLHDYKNEIHKHNGAYRGHEPRG
ncbi:MAG: V-type ATPase subunit [Defluviitaleaceae bacterium]|nr:V-type ATPase subunit [Defluviitaleaceae bacterium]